jgi:tetratricopeptide (TPR) repeat protein
MPTVYNGIGTWYYGKDRLHTRKGTCSLCNRVCTLESYDTTLFFVVIFVPVIPLAKKRILEQCSACQRHRVLPLKQWEQAKAKDSAEVLKKLENNPNDRDAILHALGMATGYQDEPLFNQVAESLAADRKDDRAIQVTLANGYVYFVRWPEAEQAYRTALALEDTEDVRESLAWTMLKQGRPDEALPFLGHILEKKKQDSAGMVYHLIAGYQAEGRHQEALAIMDERDAAFPQLVGIKEYVAQRKISERYKDTGRRIASPRLTDDKGAGYREGGWAARIPRLIPLILLASALLAYFGSAWWIGQNRKVYLVNGTDKPYKIALNGSEHSLNPQSATPVRVPEGEVTVEFRDDKAGIEPVKCDLESNFWSRPFISPTIVINPDQQAIIIEEEAIYSETPHTDPQPHWHVGQLQKTYTGVDYVFEDLPSQLQLKNTKTATKRRVGVQHLMGSEDRLYFVTKNATKPDQVKYAKAALQWNPNDAPFLYWLTGNDEADDVLQFLKPRLDARPLMVEWHRAYQTLMEVAKPEVDLREQYAKLTQEVQNSPDAVYLRGRVEDPDLRDQCFKQAAEAKPPSNYAFQGLGFDALSEGRFAEAVAYFDKAQAGMGDNLILRTYGDQALLANKEYGRLLDMLEKRKGGALAGIPNMSQLMNVAAIKGDQGRAQAIVQQILALVPAGVPEMGKIKDNLQASLEAKLACCRNDTAGYLKQMKEHPEIATVEFYLLTGKLKEAAEQVVDKAKPEDQMMYHGLLFLFAARAGNKALADSVWQKTLAELKKGGRDQRRAAEMAEGKKPFDAELICRFAIIPDAKRVILAAFAEKYPAQKKTLLDLARKLDFHHDAVSLCLKKVLKS